MLCLWKNMKHKKQLPIDKDYGQQIKMATKNFLYEKEKLGFNPSHLVTIHYYHPDENDNCHTRHNDKTNQKRFYNSLWKDPAKNSFIRKRRLNENDLITDHRQIKNVVLKELYGIKRLNKEWKYEYPSCLFVYEKGKSKVKYHTHLLLSSTTYFKSGAWRNNPNQSLEDVFNQRISKKRKCFSNWKRIHIERVFDVKGALSYLTKETDASNYSIDYHNSILPT